MTKGHEKSRVERCEKYPATWGFDGKTGQVTVYRPEAMKSVTIEEAIEDAKSGDLQALSDCIEVWRSIETGCTPAPMPIALRSFVARFVSELGELGPGPKTKPTRGRAGWVADRRLEGRLEGKLKDLEDEPFALPPHELRATAMEWIAQSEGVLRDSIRTRLERGQRGRPTKSLGYVAFDEQGRVLDTSGKVSTKKAPRRK